MKVLKRNFSNMATTLVFLMVAVPIKAFMVTTSPVANSLPAANAKHLVPKIPTCLREAASDSEVIGLSEPEQTVRDILQDLHDSDLPFRLVVVGNGAILETTSILGPTFKLGQSPRTGEPLTTFASEDQSFEFHLMISQVSKIVLTEKTGEKIMQIFRFLTAEGKPMCSLILADKSEKAQKWFTSMCEKHGVDIQL